MFLADTDLGHIFKNLLEEFRKMCRKPLTLSYNRRKLCNRTNFFRKVRIVYNYSCDVVYYLCGIAVELAVSRQVLQIQGAAKKVAP